MTSVSFTCTLRWFIMRWRGPCLAQGCREQQWSWPEEAEIMLLCVHMLVHTDSS